MMSVRHRKHVFTAINLNLGLKSTATCSESGLAQGELSLNSRPTVYMPSLEKKQCETQRFSDLSFESFYTSGHKKGN